MAGQGGGNNELFFKIEVKVDTTKLESLKNVLDELKTKFTAVKDEIKEFKEAYRDAASVIREVTHQLKDAVREYKNAYREINAEVAAFQKSMKPMIDFATELKHIKESWEDLVQSLSFANKAVVRLADATMKAVSKATKAARDLKEILDSVRKVVSFAQIGVAFKKLGDAYEDMINRINKMIKKGKFDLILKKIQEYGESIIKYSEAFTKLADSMETFSKKVNWLLVVFGRFHDVLQAVVKLLRELNYAIGGLEMIGIERSPIFTASVAKRLGISFEFLSKLKKKFGELKEAAKLLRGELSGEKAKKGTAVNPWAVAASLAAEAGNKIKKLAMPILLGLKFLDAAFAEGLSQARDIAEKTEHMNRVLRKINTTYAFTRGVVKFMLQNKKMAAYSMMLFPLWALKTGVKTAWRFAKTRGPGLLETAMEYFWKVSLSIRAKAEAAAENIMAVGKILMKTMAFLAMPSLGFAVGVSRIMSMFSGVMIPILAVSELLENLSQLVFILQQPQFMLQFAMEDITAKLRNVLYGIPNELMNLADMLAESFDVGIAEMRSEIRGEYMKVGSIAVAFYNLKMRMQKWHDSLSSVEKETVKLYNMFDQINIIFGRAMAKELVLAMRSIGYQGKDPVEMIGGTVRSMAKVLAHLTVLVFTVVDALSPLFEVMNKVVGSFGRLVANLIKSVKTGNLATFYKELDRTFSSLEKALPGLMYNLFSRIGKVLDAFLKITSDIVKAVEDPKKRGEMLKKFEELAGKFLFGVVAVLGDIGRIIVRLGYASAILLGNFLLDVFGKIGEALAKTFKPVIDAVSWLWNTFVVGPINALFGALKAIGDGIVAITRGIIDIFVFRVIISLKPLAAVFEYASGFLETIGLKGPAEMLRGLANAINSSLDWLEKAKEDWKKAVGEWGYAITSTIVGVPGWIAEQAGNAVGAIGKAMDKATKDFRDYMLKGEKSVTGYAADYVVLAGENAKKLKAAYVSTISASSAMIGLAGTYVEELTTITGSELSEIYESLEKGEISRVWPLLREAAAKGLISKETLERLALAPQELRIQLLKQLAGYLRKTLETTYGTSTPESVYEEELVQIVGKWAKKTGDTIKKFGERVSKIAWLYARDISGALISWQDATNRIGEITLELPDVGKVKAPVRAINSFISFMNETRRAISSFVNAFTRGETISMATSALRALTNIHVLIDTYQKLQEEAKEKGFSLGALKYLNIDAIKRLAKELPVKFGNVMKDAVIAIFNEMKRQVELLSAFTEDEAKALKMWTLASMKTPRTIADLTKYLTTIATKGDKEFTAFSNIALKILKKFASTVAGSVDTAAQVIYQELAEAEYIVDELNKGILGLYVNVKGKITTFGQLITNLAATFENTGLTYRQILDEILVLDKFANLFTKYGNPFSSALAILTNFANLIKSLYDAAITAFGGGTKVVAHGNMAYVSTTIPLAQAYIDALSGGATQMLATINKELELMTDEVRMKVISMLPQIKPKLQALINLFGQFHEEILKFYAKGVYNQIQRGIDTNIDYINAILKGATDTATKANDVVANVWDFNAFKNVTITLKGQVKKLSDLQNAVNAFTNAMRGLENAIKNLGRGYSIEALSSLANLLNVYVAFFGDKGVKEIQAMANELYDTTRKYAKFIVGNLFALYSKVWQPLMMRWVTITQWQASQSAKVTNYLISEVTKTEALKSGLYYAINGVYMTFDEFVKLVDEMALTLTIGGEKVVTTLRNLVASLNQTKQDLQQLFGFHVPTSLNDIFDTILSPISEIVAKRPHLAAILRKGYAEKIAKRAGYDRTMIEIAKSTFGEKWLEGLVGESTANKILTEIFGEMDVEAKTRVERFKDEMMLKYINFIMKLRGLIGPDVLERLKNAFSNYVDHAFNVIADAIGEGINYTIVENRVVTKTALLSEIIRSDLKDITQDVEMALGVLNTSFQSVPEMLIGLTRFGSLLVQSGDETLSGKALGLIQSLRGLTRNMRKRMDRFIFETLLEVLGGEEGIVKWIEKSEKVFKEKFKGAVTNVLNEAKIAYEAITKTSDMYMLINGNLVSWVSALRNILNVSEEIEGKTYRLRDIYEGLRFAVEGLRFSGGDIFRIGTQLMVSTLGYYKFTGQTTLYQAGVQRKKRIHDHLRKRLFEFFEKQLGETGITIAEASFLLTEKGGLITQAINLAKTYTMIFIGLAKDVLNLTALELSKSPLQYYKGQVTNISQILSGTISTITVRAGGATLTYTVDEFTRSISAMVDALTNIAQIGSKVPSLRNLVTTLGQIYSFADFMVEQGYTRFANIREKAKALLVKSHEKLMYALAEAIKEVGTLLDNLSDEMLLRIEKIRMTNEKLRGLYQTAKQALPNVGALFSLDIVGFVESLGSASNALTTLGANTKGLKLFGIDIGGALMAAGGFLANVFGMLTGGMGTAILAILQVLFDVLKPILEPLINAFVSGFMGSLLKTKSVTDAISWLMNAFQNMLTFAFQLGVVLGQIVAPILDIVIRLAGAIGNVLVPIFTLLADVILFVGRVIASVVNLIATILRPIIDFIVALFNFVASILNVFVGIVGGLIGGESTSGGSEVINVNVNINSGANNPFLVDDIIYAINKAKYRY